MTPTVIIWRRALAAGFAAAAMNLPGEVMAQGCAMCQTYNNGQPDPITQGYNSSILLMICMPYAIFGTVGGWLAFTYWRAHRRSLQPRILPFVATQKESVQ